MDVKNTTVQSYFPDKRLRPLRHQNKENTEEYIIKFEARVLIFPT